MSPETSSDAAGPLGLDAVAEEMGIGVALLDEDGRISVANRVAVEHLALLGGFADAGLESGAAVQRVVGRVLSTVGGLSIGELLAAASEVDLAVDDAGIVVAVKCEALDDPQGATALVTRDVTVRRARALALAQEEKLTAIADTLGSLTHALRNIFQAVTGFAEVLARRDDVPDEARRRLELVATEGRRGAELVEGLTVFRGKSHASRVPVDLQAFVTEYFAGLSPGLPEGVGAHLEVAEDQGSREIWVEADVVQIGEALDELVVNALRSMPGGGDLEVSICTVSGPVTEVTGPPRRRVALAAVPPLGEGEWAVLAVTDTGAGVPPEQLGRVLDPLFTDDPGGSRGMGLAGVYGVLRSHGGSVAVTSRVGHGTTVGLCLPLAGRPA